MALIFYFMLMAKELFIPKEPQKSRLSDATAKKVADVLHLMLNEKKKK